MSLGEKASDDSKEADAVAVMRTIVVLVNLDSNNVRLKANKAYHKFNWSF